METILLIEDNDVIRDNTAEILALAGYTVLTAENGKAGIEAALATRPDLVICDIMMPVLDGYGVLQIMNKNPQLAGIPFIFLTAKTERTDFRKGMELGADDYLTKPFDESELLRAIEGRLSRLRTLGTPSGVGAEAAQGDYTRFAGLLDNRKPHLVRKRQYIYAAGDAPTRLYYLKAGKVKITRTNADGKELLTGLHQAGDVFGYVALLQETDYAESAVTLEDSELIYVPSDELRQLLLTSPDLARELMRRLAQQLSNCEAQLLGMAYGSLRRRVADTLLRLQNQHPEAPIRLSRDDLAAVVGTATESLIRLLSEFKQEGLIEQDGSGIWVRRPDSLRRAVW